VTETVEQYRARARSWLKSVADADADYQRADFGSEPAALAAARAFQADMHDRGFAGVSWPSRFGGAGLTIEYERAFAEEASVARVPFRRLFLAGLGVCAPTLLQLGTDEQRERYLPALLRGDQLWCQLYSEPAAGSDLAGLRTQAKPAADGWTVTGQKLWTSHARACDFGLVLARTDPVVPKHAGLSMFVIVMRQPGITLRPVRQMTGEADFNEVFLDAADIAPDGLVGELGDGWRAARASLTHERASLGSSADSLVRLTHTQVAEVASRSGAADDPVVRERVARLFLREWAVQQLGERIRQQQRAGADPGAITSVAKLAKGVLTREAAELAFELAGTDAAAWPDGAAHAGELADALSRSRIASIAGGTDEIQHNVIGERVLGLPREPSSS
jgi:alkylation response protein AidB-like acyl-CoA dehydrogenase